MRASFAIFFYFRRHLLKYISNICIVLLSALTNFESCQLNWQDSFISADKSRKRLQQKPSAAACKPIYYMRPVGLEPTRFYPQEPKSCMSANSIKAACLMSASLTGIACKHELHVRLYRSKNPGAYSGVGIWMRHAGLEPATT